ncbi:MAG: tetratricopeptide repeat protein, partial [Bacteroidales bacterium]|nr:tetratricopeptide repeat protein [Bacteroidales bacterium]
MKRFFLSLAALFATFSMISAQDIASATQTARLANEALTAGNYTEALAGFTSALAAANSCGEAGESLATVCKGVIPRIVSAIAKQKLQENEYDAAITGFTQAVALAKEYGDAETVTSATALIPQAYMKKGLAQLNASEYAAAEEAYKKALELDPTNGVAALRYGMALEAQGKADAALDSYRKAAENGQQANAYAQLGKHFLRSAADYLKSKEYDEAVMDAVKSFEYVANPQA